MERAALALCDWIILLTMQKDLRTAWLLVMLRDGESYGYELRRELAARAGELDPAVMYRSLREMERGGLISSRWMHSQTGPRRRVYDIAPAGRRKLVQVAEEIVGTRDALNALLAELGQLDGTDHSSPP
jgi:PadR family transcriptional regulator PadR